jgi:hypothetical protein
MTFLIFKKGRKLQMTFLIFAGRREPDVRKESLKKTTGKEWKKRTGCKEKVFKEGCWERRLLDDCFALIPS